MLSRLFLMLLCLLGAMNQASGYSVRVLAAHSEEDVSNAFYIELAKLALSKGAGERDVPNILSTVPMNQVRAIRELEKGNLELLWIGTDIQKEKRFRAIRIPLHKGMMGYRRFIINKQDENKFSGIETVAELSLLSACQGVHWPDTKIMQAEGLNILSTPIHANLYEQLGKGKCDYFPRALHEAPVEVKAMNEEFPSFQVYDGLILHYPFAIYFFTTKENEWLAQWVEDGLEKMIDDGELIEFLQQHAYTSHVFPLQRYQSSTFVKLSNPLLPEGTPIENSRYWLSTDAFKH